MTASATPALLWRPDADRIARSQVRRFIDWLAAERGLDFADYDALWQWSIADLDAFWAAIWDFFGVVSADGYETVLADRRMPGAVWFPEARLNYVDQVFRHATTERPAILHAAETRDVAALSWADLEDQVASVAAHLKACGVQRGDRVVAYAPNVPETIVAFLAAASIGAVWSVCAPDMGVQAVLDRFRQIEPVVLFAVASCDYGGKHHNKTEMLAALIEALPSLRNLVLLPATGTAPAAAARLGVAGWAEVVASPAVLEVEKLSFDHPLWIVYSSGTTGLPKPIVHGHGGIVLVGMGLGALHNDLGPDDVFHWYSSTGWIMWNAQVNGLLGGCTIAIYDGSPAWPDWGTLWRFAGKVRATFFGAGAAFFASCQKAGIVPRELADLSALRTIGSTGSPLSEDSYQWIYDQFPADIWLTPISGGTDFAGAFVGGCPILPVYAGEMQCRCLGAAIAAFDEAGRPLIDEVGELVCTAPIPSMPLYLWNDPDGERYRGSYFDTYPGVWRHGDWLRITTRGGAVIYGRSDATINRQGLRLGTAEIYRAVEELPEILDSLVVDLEYLGRESFMPLFVVLRPGLTLDDALKQRLADAIRRSVSARFVPNDIIQVAEVPRTLSGKKLEVPVKKILLGQQADKVANAGAMANPGSLAWYADYARRLNG